MTLLKRHVAENKAGAILLSTGLFILIGGFAYLTDTNDIPDASLELLADLDVLVLDALRDEPHPTHFHIEEACRVADRIGATATYFTHMTHSVLHEETNRSLPAGVQLAYDGLRVRTRAEVGVS